MYLMYLMTQYPFKLTTGTQFFRKQNKDLVKFTIKRKWKLRVSLCILQNRDCHQCRNKNSFEI